MFSDTQFKLFVVVYAYLSCCAFTSYQDDSDDRNPSFSSHNKCQPITVQFCQNIEYNVTIMPNLLNHQNQKDVALDVQTYYPVLKVKCNPDIHFFLCSVYTPICIPFIDEPLPPCKSLCLSVRKSCEGILNKFSHKWPEDLNCDKFPEESENVLCVSKNNNSNSNNRIEVDHVNVNSYNENEGYINQTGMNSLNSKYKSSTKFFKQSNDVAYITGNRSKKFNFTCPDHFYSPKGYYDSIRVGNVIVQNCSLPCNDMFFTPEEIQFSRIWIGGWSIVCALSCLFTVLTFLQNTSRFRYPERPIIFLSICYLIVSLIYVLGFIFGDKIACREPSIIPNDKPQLPPVATIVQGTKDKYCTIVFIGLYFFNMASSLWWVILALTWFLAAGLKWGHEAIEANSQYFHLAAWAIPAIKTITILAKGKVEGKNKNLFEITN